MFYEKQGASLMSELLLGRYRIHITRNSPTALSQQICDQIRCAITQGHWSGGSRLPSTRELATHLDVSRNTISAVYDQLAIEGYVVLSQGRRPNVAQLAPGVLLGKETDAANEATLPPLSNWALRLGRDSWPPIEKGQPRPLMPGLADERGFPHAVWARCLRSAARHGFRANDGRANRLRLQQLLVGHLKEHRGVLADAEQVFILPTAQAALDLVARVVSGPGDVAWVESPGYEGARAAFEAAGATVLGMDLDQSGLLIPERASSSSPRCIFLTPSHQYPTGRLMPIGRRLSLLKFASTVGGYIIEDDYDGEFHYQGKPVAALQGLDKADRVFYVGSFSKSMHMGMRAGYLVAPRHLVHILQKAQRHTGQMLSLNVQDALSEFIGEGHYASHLRKMIRIYRMRRDHLCDGLSRLDADLRVRKPDGGMQVLAELLSAVDDETLVRRLGTAGVSVRSLSRHYLDNASTQGMFIGFAAWNETEIDQAVHVIANVLGARGGRGDDEGE
jgi:GntR family transcriptional regulator/MocR family aminotransferase